MTWLITTGRLVKHIWIYCTSAVHVAGHYGMQVASLKVKQEAGFRTVSLHTHQSVQDHLHTLDKHMYNIQTFRHHNCESQVTWPNLPVLMSTCLFTWPHLSACAHLPSWAHWGPPTWLRCSIEFDSLPVFSSRGTVFSRDLWLPFRGLWTRTRAVTSIFPFRPNLGDHTFSSISASSVTVTTVAESWSLLGAVLLLRLESWRQRQTYNQLFQLTKPYLHW